MDQEQLARELSDDLQDCGHDVTYLDLLDCLASCGLELIKPPGAAAGAAYLAALERVRKQGA